MQISDNWSWTVCNLSLRHLAQADINNPVIWSLKPSITLLHPKKDGPNPIINLSVDSEKSFQFSDELGWNWHKSWKLPTVSVQLELVDPNTNEPLLCPKDIFVQIFAVKASLDENKKVLLTDVGLKGTTKMELLDGKGIFQTLKFASTSYNNEGVKFHLVMCLYLQISEDTPPKIFKSIISPPIFVDSRKSVRDAEKLSDNKLYLYMNPFSPDNFTKRFVKRETKKKESIEEDIQNNIEGFFSYLTAPNIRNKVKHPVFLSVRFSNCISLFYNPSGINADVRPNFAEILQELLFRDIEKTEIIREVTAEESIFIMCIDLNLLEDKTKRKKISESINPVKYQSLTVLFSRPEVPAHFVQLTDLGMIMELYSKSYSKIAKKAKSYLQEEENEEEDGPTERLPPPDKQSLNFLVKPLKRIEWYRYFDIHLPEEIPQKKLKTEANSLSPTHLVLESTKKISSSDPSFQILRGDSDETTRSMEMISLPKKVGEPSSLVSYQNHPNHHSHPGLGVQNIQNIQSIHNIQNIQNIQQNIQNIQNIQQTIQLQQNLQRQQQQQQQQQQNIQNLHGIQNIQTIQGIQGIQSIQNIQGIQTPVFIGLVQNQINHQGDNLNNVLQGRQLIGNGLINNSPGNFPLQTMQMHPNGTSITIIPHNPYQNINQINSRELNNGSSMLNIFPQGMPTFNQKDDMMNKLQNNQVLAFQMQDKAYDETYKYSDALQQYGYKMNGIQIDPSNSADIRVKNEEYEQSKGYQIKLN